MIGESASAARDRAAQVAIDAIAAEQARVLRDIVVRALEPYDIPTGRSWTAAERVEPAQVVLDAVPDGWAKVDGEWIRITSDGVGYGEFDRDTGRTEQ